MPSAYSVYLPPLYQKAPEAGRLILRDGSTAAIHIADARIRVKSPGASHG